MGVLYMCFICALRARTTKNKQQPCPWMSLDQTAHVMVSTLNWKKQAAAAVWRPGNDLREQAWWGRHT